MMVVLLAIAVLSDTVQTSQALRRKLDVKPFATIHHEVKNKTLRTKLKKANKGLLITMPRPASALRKRYISWRPRWTLPPATESAR